MLPTPKALTLHPAYQGLLDLLEARYVASDALARRWVWSEQHLANLRRSGKGPAFTRIGRSVRYPVAEVVAWELAGQSAHLTRDRLAVAVTALRGYTLDQRADILAQITSIIGQPQA